VSETRWTPEQWAGITTVGQSLLVSAAAGSGKTAMLAERCAYLVCDAPEPCDIDELLVVTFTDAASTEMKARITQALRTRAERDGPTSRAAQQSKLVECAHVSTLHSFCARVLRQYFHLVGLDPAFTLLDGEEASLLRKEIARDVFADGFELDDAGTLQRFVDGYGDGDDARLARLLVRAHEMLTSLVDPSGWMTHARTRIEQAASLPLDESQMGRELLQLIAIELQNLEQRCDRALEQLSQLGGFEKYLAVVRDAKQIVKHWSKVFQSSGLSALKEESEITFDRLPSVSNNVPNKELAKAAVDSVRDAMKEGTWRELLRFSPDEWSDGLRAILPHAKVFLQLIEQFVRKYRIAKDSIRALDFADLERFTLRVLTEPKSLKPSTTARSFHRRFKHVLVDEYQDINEVQDAILSLVSTECISDGKKQRANLFTVGDVKQSIYRFRLAEAGRFLQRQRNFRADGGKRIGSVIDLQKNFRSRAPLLDAINGVFMRLMIQDAVDITYDESHRLHAGAEYPPGDGVCTFAGAPIELHLLPAKLASAESTGETDCDDADLDRAEREAVLVAQRIREMMGLDGGKPAMCITDRGSKEARPLRFRDIVILLRSMKFKAQRYADVLLLAGVPVHAESGTGYFESTEVSDLLSLLSLLNNGRQDVPLAAVLRSPLARLANAEESLAQIRIAYPTGGGLAFHEAVHAYAREKNDALADKLREILATLKHWRELAQRRPLADVILEIYEQSGYLAYVSGLLGGQQRVANLLNLLERARQFGTFHRQGLARFMQFIDTLREESDLGQPSIASEADDVVRITSIHRSKGLEFPVVILPDLGKQINLDDCHGNILLDRSLGIGLSVVDERKRVRYPSLASTLVRAKIRQQALAEEMRVLYVAMTRAKEHLVLVGTVAADAEEKWRSRWAGHGGVFPSDVVLGVSSMLDWLGPVAASTGLQDEIIRIQTHGAEEVGSWRTQAKRRQGLTPRQEKLARLEPLDPAPPADPAAEELIGRLTSRYPHEPLTQLAASRPMSGKDAETSIVLTPALFTREIGPASGADIGTATHLVLEHLDFCRPCDRADVEAQLAELVKHRLIAPAEKDLVDVDSIVWMMQSSAGELMRRHAAALRRELPIFVADASNSSDDPNNCQMLRGRIDVFIPLPDGGIVIDYKTDRVDSEGVKSRAEYYGQQMSAYRRAIEAATRMPVGKVLLVFLHTRVVQAV
jgi:ATP-dependent helicase/nuclease subunit A